MKCPQCGAQVDGDFCPYCGSANETNATKNEETPKATPTNTSNTKAEKPKKPIYKKWWFCVLVVIVVVNISNRLGGNDRVENFVWSDMELNEFLPEPEATLGEIISNSDTSLSIYVHKTSEEDYKEYLSNCETLGYVVEKDKSEHNFSAYNNEGYKLSLWYNESDEILHIGLDAPLEMGDLVWPKSKIGSLLPTPASKTGKIEWEADYGFVINVGNTTKADYDKYVNSCIDKGFNVDYNKGDDYFQADNAEGYHISLRYDGNNVMWVRADEPDGDSSDTESKENDESEEVVDASERTYEVVRKYVALYNEKLDPDILNTEEYITEDRILKYDEAYAIKGDIDGNYISIINFGSYDIKDNMRIEMYADTPEEVFEILSNVSIAIGKPLTEEECAKTKQYLNECFTDEYQKYTEWTGVNSITYFSRHNAMGDNYEVLVEFPIDKFYK